MIRSELVQKIAEDNPALNVADAERIVTTIFDEIISSISSGNRVELRGFGAFSVKKREARTGRNPKTGDAVSVDSKHIPFFKTGKLLRDRLNGNNDSWWGIFAAYLYVFLEFSYYYYVYLTKK